MANLQYVDVVVIGGGIAGVSCAAEISATASVALLEAESQWGYHATGRSAAVTIPSSGGTVINHLINDSLDFLSSPPQALEVDSFLSPRGQLLVATTEQDSQMHDYLDRVKGVTECTVDEAMQLVPILRRESIRRASIETAVQDIDVDLLLQKRRKICHKNGAQFFRSSRVIKLEKAGDVWKVCTKDAEIQSPIVINAAGAWADEIAQMAGLQPLGLMPCRRSAALLQIPSNFNISHWPVFSSVLVDWYAKPVSGKLMVSPAEEIAVEPHDAFVDDLTLAEGIDRYQQMVNVDVTRVEHSWAGLRTFAPDRVPVVGYDPRVNGFFWLAGQGGYGIETSPALSMIVASLLTDKALSPQSQELCSFLKPDRFIN